MVSCAKCGHPNLPSSTTCSKCGAPLPTAVAPAGPPIIDSVDEYARQVAAREAIRKRNKMIVAAIAAVVVIALGYLQVKERNRKAAAQEKLNYAEKFVELEKRETGAFWNCVMASEVDVGMFQKAEQFQQRIESAYFTQQKTFSDYLTTECVPKMERARQAFGGLRDAPVELQGPIDKYREILPKLQSGLEDYRQSAYGVDIELEAQLKASFPKPGDSERLRELITADIGVNEYGIKARMANGTVVYTVPIGVFVGKKANN